MEQRLLLGEISNSIGKDDANKVRAFAAQLSSLLPKSPSAEKTNLTLNWVVAACAVLGVVLAVVPLIKARPQDSQYESDHPILPVNPSMGSHADQSPGARRGDEDKGRAPDIPSGMRVLHPIQLGVILVLACLQKPWLRAAESRIAKRRTEPSQQIATGTLEQFRNSWVSMWWAWAVLYAWFTFAALAVHKEYSWVLAIGDVVNAVTGVFIWRCFLVLDLPSVKLPGQQLRDRSYRKAVSVTIVCGICIGILGCADRYLHLGHAGVTAVGAYNALGLACLAGRFTSHWMMVSRVQILFLYTYSMLQLIYPFFDLLGDRWEMGVYITVLILKVMLANTLRSMLEEGGLDNYLEAAQAGKLGFMPMATTATSPTAS